MEKTLEDVIQEKRKQARRKMKRKIAEARAALGDRYSEVDITKAWTRKFHKVEDIPNKDAENFELKKVTNGYERQQTDPNNK